MHASVDKEDMSLSFTVVSKREEEEENIAFYHKEPRKGSGFADTIQQQQRRDHHREIHREERLEEKAGINSITTPLWKKNRTGGATPILMIKDSIRDRTKHYNYSPPSLTFFNSKRGCRAAGEEHRGLNKKKKKG